MLFGLSRRRRGGLRLRKGKAQIRFLSSNKTKKTRKTIKTRKTRK